jgi:hypothetical protein
MCTRVSRTSKIDEAEVARRSASLPPTLFLAPPAFPETAQDKDSRSYSTKQGRRKKAVQDKEAGYLCPRTMPSCRNPSRPALSVQPRTSLHQLPSHEETNPQQKFVPNFGARKLDNPHGDNGGSDVYLPTLDSLIENLIKTPVRNSANDPTSHGDSTNTISCTGTAANGHTSRVHRIRSLRRKRSTSLGNPVP